MNALFTEANAVATELEQLDFTSSVPHVQHLLPNQQPRTRISEMAKRARGVANMAYEAEEITADFFATACEWIPRLPDATLLAAERSQCIPRDGDHVVVAGVTWRAYTAIHDAMGCVVPLGPRVPADDGFDLTRARIKL